MYIVDSRFTILEMEVVFLLQDSDDEFRLPLHDENKFESMGVVSGQNPRMSVDGFLARTQFQKDCKRFRKIDDTTIAEDRLLDESDTIPIEPQSGLHFDPVNVVLRPEVEGP